MSNTTNLGSLAIANTLRADTSMTSPSFNQPSHYYNIIQFPTAIGNIASNYQTGLNKHVLYVSVATTVQCTMTWTLQNISIIDAASMLNKTINVSAGFILTGSSPVLTVIPQYILEDVQLISNTASANSSLLVKITGVVAPVYSGAGVAGIIKLVLTLTDDI
jgi:hypothetical protein